MAHAMEDDDELLELYELYGLSCNPFEPNPLDPRIGAAPTPAEVDNLYARVDGFAKHAGKIQTWCGARGRFQERSLVVVYGPKKCGRTSVANYIYYHLSRHYGPTKAQDRKLLPVRFEITNEDEIRPTEEILTQLYEYIQTLDEFFVEPLQSLGNDFRKYLIDAEQPHTFNAYRDLFRRTRRYLEERKHIGIAVILENVRSETKQTPYFTQLFTDIPLLLLTTYVKSVYEPYRHASSPIFSIELGELNFQDVSDFLDHRWKALARDKNNPQGHPFPPAGLKQMCPTELITRPFHGVISVLDSVFTEFLTVNVKPIQPRPAVGPRIDYEFMGPAVSRYMEELGLLVRPTEEREQDG